MNRKTARRLLRIISRVPGLYAALAFILARRVTIRGWSMAPTLLPDERLLVDRLAYTRDRPRSSDIVLVAHPHRSEMRVVKRLTGVPGDTVTTRDGDRLLARGEYWVEGDDPGRSTDSHAFGPVGRGELLGRAWLRYWPAERWLIWDRRNY